MITSIAQENAKQLGFIEDEDGTIRIEDVVIPCALPPVLSTDVPDKRLVIETIVAKNFKSYAGVQTLGPFNKNFTAIVGPNGSGKSNVIDSLLFVFGYRSKKIRTDKVHMLIHKSDKYPNIQSCKVTVNFAYIKDEGDDAIVIPNSKFAISRTAFQDNSSHYEMNGKRVQYKEIAKALRAFNIDLDHNRFLILQGEIEAISLLPPMGRPEKEETGMLEYIEDVIGTNRFIEPTKIFKEKVDALTAEHKVLVSQLQLLEKERDELEVPKNRALEFLRLENKVCKASHELYQLKRYETQKQLEIVLEKKKKVKEELEKIKVGTEKNRAAKKEYEASVRNLASEHDTLQKLIDSKKDAFNILEREDAKNIDCIKNKKDKVKSLEGIIESTKQEQIKSTKQVSTFEQETVELQKRKKKLAVDIDEESEKAKQVVGSTESEVLRLRDLRDKLKEDLMDTHKAVLDRKAELDLVEVQYNLTVDAPRKAQQILNAKMKVYQSCLKTKENEEKAMSTEKDKLKQTTEELRACEERLKEAKKEENELSAEWRTCKAKLDEAKITEAATRNRSEMIKAFHAEKAAGRLPGFHGRLGDLGAIDAKYDVAISTACGALDNIVVDTVETGKKCVQFLKDKELGYATFIPLKKMQVWKQHTMTPMQTPENVPRLFDLVKVKNPDYLVAFYYALHNTLVAKDLTQATRIGLQGRTRHRVVSLQGELIDSLGTMSGGGNKITRGRMGTSIVDTKATSQYDLIELTRQDKHLTKTVTDLRQEIRCLDEKISQKERLILSLQNSLAKRLNNYDMLQDNVRASSAEVETVKKDLGVETVDEKAAKELEAKIKAKKKELQVAEENQSIMQQKYDKVYIDLNKHSKGKQDKSKKLLSTLQTDLKKTTEALSKSEVNLKRAQRNVKKCEEIIKNKEREIEQIKKEIVLLKEKQNSMTEEGKQITQAIVDSESKLQKLKEEMGASKKNLASFELKDQEFKKDELDYKNKLQEVETKEAEKKGYIKTINSKISKLKLNEVENDPVDLPNLTEEEILNLSESSLTNEIEVAKVKLEGIKPDLSSIADYNAKVKVCDAKQAEVDAQSSRKNLTHRRYDWLCNTRTNQFSRAFNIIGKKLKEIYQMLTLGGDAELESVEGSNPFIKGIDFCVRPPKKSWKYMRNLSGGEKTLSSLALVFALHYYRPTPFYVMDEIDAALDVRNVAIVGYFLKEKTKNTQFIIVSLRNVMNEQSDHLLGIFKIKDCTRSLSIHHVHKWYEDENENEQNNK